MNERDLLLVTTDFPPNRGGVARYLALFCEYFSARIHVIAQPIEKDSEMMTTYSVERRALLSKHIWPHWLASVLILLQKSNSYRCVITSHVLPFGTAAMVAKWVTKKPYIVITHGMDVRLAMKSKRGLLNRVLRNAHLVVANSNALAQELQNTFHLQNILTVYPPVDPAFFISSEKQSSDHFELLSVSRLVDRKGHERVLQALALLKMSGSFRSFHYTIIGDGPTRESLESLAIELEIDSHVTFLGDVSDEILNTAYANADVFILPVKDDPLDKEGFGMVYLEAAAFGVPSIATNIPGVNEAILDKETGVLVPDGDLSALSQAILELAINHAFRNQLGEAARLRAETVFTPNAQFSKLEPYLV